MPTAALVSVNGVDTLPAGTVTTIEGTRPLEDEIETAAPPAGAAPVRNTVPLTEDPPVIVPGLKLKLLSVIGGAGTRAREACPEFRLYVAVKVTEVCTATVEVVPVTDTLVAPVGSGTELGT